MEKISSLEVTRTSFLLSRAYLAKLERDQAMERLANRIAKLTSAQQTELACFMLLELATTASHSPPTLSSLRSGEWEFEVRAWAQNHRLEAFEAVTLGVVTWAEFTYENSDGRFGDILLKLAREAQHVWTKNKIFIESSADILLRTELNKPLRVGFYSIN